MSMWDVSDEQRGKDEWLHWRPGDMGGGTPESSAGILTEGLLSNGGTVQAQRKVLPFADMNMRVLTLIISVKCETGLFAENVWLVTQACFTEMATLITTTTMATTYVMLTILGMIPSVSHIVIDPSPPPLKWILVRSPVYTGGNWGTDLASSPRSHSC